MSSAASKSLGLQGYSIHQALGTAENTYEYTKAWTTSRSFAMT